MNSAGSALVYSTYLSNNTDTAHLVTGNAVAYDPSGNLLVTGLASKTFPVTSGLASGTCPTNSFCAFVAKVNPSAQSPLVYSLVFTATRGGPTSVYPSSNGKFVAADASGNVYVAGTVVGTGFPTINPVQPAFGGGLNGDIFALELTPDGSSLLMSTYLGGARDDIPGGLAVSNGKVYLTGNTASTDFPVSAGAYSSTLKANPIFSYPPPDAFLTAIDTTVAAAAACVPVDQELNSVQVGSSGVPENVVVTNCGSADLTVSSASTDSQQFSVSAGACASAVPPGGTCNVPVVFTPATRGYQYTTLTIQSNGNGSPQHVSLVAYAFAPQIGTIPTSTYGVQFGNAVVGIPTPASVLTIFSNGDLPLSLTSITASGDYSQTNNCPSSLPQGTVCTVQVTFTPTTTGIRNGTIIINSNDPANPTLSVPLMGYGVTTYPVPAITLLNQYAAKVNSGPVTLNINGTGFLVGSLVRWNSTNLPTTYINNTTIKAVIDPSLLTAMGDALITVWNPAPGGGSSAAVLFTVYNSIDVVNNDLYWDPFGHKLWASLPGSVLNIGNTLALIDPASASIVSTVPVGSNPNHMAGSADGHYLFIGLDGENAFTRFDLTTQTAGPKYGLTCGSSNICYASSLAVQPGAPNTVVIARQQGSSPSEAGVAVFDNGVQRTTATPGFTAPDYVWFSDTTGALYGSDYYSGFWYLNLASSGVSVASTTNVVNGRFRVADGLAYFNSGRVFDPIGKTLAGTYSAGQNVTGFDDILPVLPARLAFALDTFDHEIFVFNMNTFSNAGVISFTGAPLNTSNFFFWRTPIRWSADGIAFSTGNQIIIFKTSLLDTAEATANTAPFGSLDSATALGSNSSTLYSSGTLKVSGWAADKEDGSAIGRVQILVDHQPVGNATLGAARPDVATSYNDLRYASSGWTFSLPVAVLPVGSHTVSAVAYDTAGASTPLPGSPSFSIVVVQNHRVAGDLNGDGKGDILWRNIATGQNAVWLMNGGSVSGGALLPSISDLTWSIVGEGDFDGDGNVDILWRNIATGQNAIWFMNGTTLLNGQFLTSMTDLNWQVAAVGDFDGDGRADILWRNTSTGEVALWLMNGSTLAQNVALPTVADPSFVVGAAADFDGDGHADVLWHSLSTGQNAIWFMSAATVLRGQFISPTADGNWAVAGAGDFDGDGHADILWRNRVTGQDALWLMNGGAVVAGQLLPTADGNWQPAAVADFDGDGHADVLWHNQATGQNAIWFMNGTSLIGGQYTSTAADLNWQIASAKLPPRGWIDFAGNQSQGTSIVQGGTLVASGWAVDRVFGLVAKIQVLVDGQPAGWAAVGKPRPDVAASLGDSRYTNSGWSFSNVTGALAPGPHTVTALAFNPAGTASLLGPPQAITITAP